MNFLIYRFKIFCYSIWRTMFKSKEIQLFLILYLATFLIGEEESTNVTTRYVGWLLYRDYQYSRFFQDQLQTFIERCIRPQRFQMWTNSSKNNQSLLKGLGLLWLCYFHKVSQWQPGIDVHSLMRLTDCVNIFEKSSHI